ncbi:MAG: HTH domain-containing protein [Nocardioides sp.]
MAKKWTPSEEKYLLKNYGKVPMAELADRFGVTRKAISAKLDKLRQTHGIDPVGARERATARQRRQAQLNEKVPQTGGANPRKSPARRCDHASADRHFTRRRAGRVSGNY